MKKDIHPQYNSQATLSCSCGAKLVTGAIRDLEVETCSQCHPFFTGKQKIVDSAGRVEKFKQLTQKVSEAQKKREAIRSKEEKKQAKIEKQAKKETAKA